jgi:iron complex outermembrane receptor protein
MPASCPPFRLCLAAGACALTGLVGWTNAQAQVQVPVPVQVPVREQAEPPGERVVITASGAERRVFATPYAVGTVDADELRAAGPMVNLSEALARVPGVVASNRHNYAQDLQISSRGFGARASFGVRGVRLVADGIPASGPDGQGQVSHFDLAGAQRVEVLRGPFSALYGSSSGGVIALVSAAPTERRLGIDGDMGSGGLLQSRFALDLPLPGGLSVRTQFSALRTDGWRPQSSAERLLASARLGWEGPADRVVLTLGALDQPALDPLGLTRAQLEQNPRQTNTLALPQDTPGQADRFNTRKDTRQEQAGLHWRHRFTGEGALRESLVTLYGGRRAVTQWQAIPVATQLNPVNPTLTERHPGGVSDFGRLFGGLDARLVWRWALPGERALQLVAGAAVDRSDEDRRGHENFVGSGAAQLLGVTGRLRRDERNVARTRDTYAQAELELAAGWTGTLGVRTGRLDFASTDRYVAGGNGDDSGALAYRWTTPVAALQWRLASVLNLYASAARGFESPTFSELAYRPDGLPGFNLGLRPQRSRQVELGAKWRDADRGVAAELAVFDARTEDEIGVATNRGGRTTFRNVGRTQRSGAELSLAWQVAPAWRAQLAASSLDARYVDGFTVCRVVPCTAPDLPVPPGNRIAGTLARTGYAELAWRPRAHHEWALEVRGQSRLPVNDVNSDFAAGFGLLALRARTRIALDGGWLELLARVDNLADRRVVASVIVNEGNARFFEPAPGRSLLLSARWSRPF